MFTEHAQFRIIPARCVALSLLNVRESVTEEGIEELAELIAAEGVLQNLNVYEELSAKSGATHAVVAGGRRLRAVNLLIARKRIEPDYPVPCMIVSYERAVQISLSENSGREPMKGYVENLSSISWNFFSSSAERVSTSVVLHAR